MFDDSGPIIGNCKDFIAGKSYRGKLASPTPYLVHNSWIQVSKGSCRQGFRSPWLAMVLSIFAFLDQVPGNFPLLRPSPGASAEAFLTGVLAVEEPERPFCPSLTLYP